MAEDDASKTEEPTAKKRAKAREEGQVASSQEVKSWFVLLAGGLGVVMMAPGIMRDLSDAMLKFIEAPHAIAMDPQNVRLMASRVMLDMGFILAPLLGLLLFFALASNVIQTGPVYSPKKIQPKWSKLSPLAGVKRLFSAKALVEFAKGIVKLVIVAIVCAMMAAPLFDDLILIPQMEVGQALDRINVVTLRLVAGTLAVMTVIAVLDLFFQRYSHTKQLRMTKQEVKDEHKQNEGDPMVRSRIRRIRMERAHQRMMAAVPDASVVVTNPTHFAVALKYDMVAMPAPRVVAKGVDSLAHRIREVAEEAEVPVVENPPLARALYAAVELDGEIPPEHYKAVAEIIGFVMRLKGQLPGNAAP